MIENSVIFISAYIIASVCNNIFFVLFLFSHKMKLLLFSESIIFLTFSSTDFFEHNLCGWESFSSFSLSLYEMRIQVLPSLKSFIVFRIFMQVFKGALKEAIKEYQKKYGVSNFVILYS